MDPASWSAYSQHLSRLGASMNTPSGPLAQSSHDLGLSSSLSQQDHIGGYGGHAGGPHPFLLAPSHQPASRGEHSFNSSGLFIANYDASLLSASFQSSNKGHISTFPQGPGFFKATSNRENDFSDLRTGFSHCGMPSYARNVDSASALPGSSSLGTNSLFPNSMSAGTWRPSGIMPPSCGPFGVMPHETVLQRPHLSRRSGEKHQSSKSSRTTHHPSSLMEQDLTRGYRGILSSPARPPSSYMDPNNGNHSSLLSPQNDPYFSSVTDSYYSSCSKNEFSSYGPYCSNMQNAVQRSSISPYCYPTPHHSFGAHDTPAEKTEHSSSSNMSANSSFSNFVPNNNLSHNPNIRQPNGLVSRQTVITSNTNNAPALYNSQLTEAHQNQHYSQRDPYPCPPGSLAPSSNLSTHSGSSCNVGGRAPTTAHSSNQSHYPPMSTPIPAATPAHPTPPSTMGQAHIPNLLPPMSHDSGCSSAMYNSPSNDGYYSTPGTSHSGSVSPAKQDMSQHSSPSIYSLESSNSVSLNNSPFVDPNRVHSRQCADTNPSAALVNNRNSTLPEKPGNSTLKAYENNLPMPESCVAPPDCSSQSKDCSNLQHGMKPTVHSSSGYENTCIDTKLHNVQADHQSSYNQPLNVLPECSVSNDDKPFDFSSNSDARTLDYTQKPKNNVEKSEKENGLSQSSYQPNYNYSPVKQHVHEPCQTEDSKSVFHVPEPPQQSQLEYTAGDTSSLPVDLSHVSLNLSSKKSSGSVEIDKGEESSKNDPVDFHHTEWERPVQEDESTKEPLVDELKGDLVQEEAKTQNSNQELCTSIDDMSDENKSKMSSSNIDDDLGFLVELSTTSDIDDGASKESFTGKKGKKQRGFLQSFLTFLEGSDETKATPEAGNKEDQKEASSPPPEKAETHELTDLSNKELEGECSNWLINKEAEKPADESYKSEFDKEASRNSEDKDHFEETPSLDSGLFGSTTLQKEMVVPNPEAPSFSSDEDENSTQGIFDSVAMAIQRLCDDKEDDENRDKSKAADDMKKTFCDKVEKAPKKDGIVNEEANVEMKEEESESAESQPKVSSIIVKQKRGKRRKARHLLVIKVNRLKKQTSVVPQPVKVRKKKSNLLVKRPKAKPSTSENSGRKTLMRKCKQKRFQRNSETKRKRKTRSSTKCKYVSDEAEEKDVIVLDDDDESSKEKLTRKRKLKQENINPVVKISLIPPADTSQDVPKKIKQTPGKKRRRRHHHLHKKAKRDSSAYQKETTGDSANDASKLCVATNAEGINDTMKKPESTNNETCSSTAEIQFKTGDFVTTLESMTSDQPPIWRIESKNVLQLFEAFEHRKCSILYRNTSSYSRWSPSSKHKYSSMAVTVIKCDDDSVIIEKMKKGENLEGKEVSGDNYATHPQRENFEVYLQTLVSHALDPDFIPEIVKEKDDYFLSHLQEIEKIAYEKKQMVLSGKQWDITFLNLAELYPDISINMSRDRKHVSCQLCNCSHSQYTLSFQGELYDATTLEEKVDRRKRSESASTYILCEACVQIVTLYSRLHHHKYHFYHLACKKVKDVQKENEKDSHTILEECLQDTKWMFQMFSDMIELWTSCEKYR